MWYVFINHCFIIPGRVAQSVTCLATDVCLAAYYGVSNLIPAHSHPFVEIDHEIISTVIFLPSAESFKKGLGVMLDCIDSCSFLAFLLCCFVVSHKRKY